MVVYLFLRAVFFRWFNAKSPTRKITAKMRIGTENPARTDPVNDSNLQIFLWGAVKKSFRSAKTQISPRLLRCHASREISWRESNCHRSFQARSRPPPRPSLAAAPSVPGHRAAHLGRLPSTQATTLTRRPSDSLPALRPGRRARPCLRGSRTELAS